MTLGQKLKILRERDDKTQLEVSMALNIEQSTLANYEMDKRMPKNEILIKIADLYRTTTDYLLGRTDESGTGIISVQEPDLCFSFDRVGKIISSTIFGELSLSVDEAALFFKMSLSDFQSVIKGDSWPSYEFIIAVSEKCNVSTDYLLGLTQSKRRPTPDGIYPFRTNSIFRLRIQELLAEYNEPDSFFTNFLGLTEEEFFFMKEYGFVPHISVITKLAEILSVSCDYLLGVSDDQLEKMVRTFKKLSDDNKDIIIGEMKKYMKEQIYTTTVAAGREAMKEAK